MDFDVKQLVTAIKAIAEEKNPEATVQEGRAGSSRRFPPRLRGPRARSARYHEPASGDVDAYVTKEIVDNVEDEFHRNCPKRCAGDAQNAAVGETIEIHQEVKLWPRGCSGLPSKSCCKRLREAEREIVMEEHEDKSAPLLTPPCSARTGRQHAD